MSNYPNIKARNRAILTAVKTGMNYRAIGKLHGISNTRVGQIVNATKRASTPRTVADELSNRIKNALDAERCPISPAAIVKRYTFAELRRVPNLGAMSIRQLNAWLVKHGQKEIQ